MKPRHAQKVRVPGERRQPVACALCVNRIESSTLKTARGNGRCGRDGDHRLARDNAMVRLHRLAFVSVACSRNKPRDGARLPEARGCGCCCKYERESADEEQVRRPACKSGEQFVLAHLGELSRSRQWAHPSGREKAIKPDRAWGWRS